MSPVKTRPAIAWVEEWMSWRAANVIPLLAQDFDIVYVTTGQDVPSAALCRVIRLPQWKTMMIAGFALSRCVDGLYREGEIDMAVVYGSVGYAIRTAPYLTIEGGSVYREWQVLSPFVPRWQKLRSPVGLLHYVVPEIVCVRRAQHVIANSGSLRSDLIALHRLPADRVSVVYNGIGPEYLDVFADRRTTAPPTALYVGRLHARKGVRRVLEAFVNRPDIAIRFVVAGDGPDRASIERLAAIDTRIGYVGHVDRSRLLELYRTATAFVFPTYYEGCPSALIEAMAAGLACVAYDTPVTRESLGDAGVLSDLGDASELVDQLGRLVRSPARAAACGARAHDRARQFSWRRCAAEIGRIVHAHVGATSSSATAAVGSR